MQKRFCSIVFHITILLLMVWVPVGAQSDAVNANDIGTTISDFSARTQTGGTLEFGGAQEEGTTQTWRWRLLPRTSLKLQHSWRGFEELALEMNNRWGAILPIPLNADKSAMVRPVEIVLTLVKRPGGLRVLQRVGGTVLEKWVAGLPEAYSIRTTVLRDSVPLVSPYYQQLLEVSIYDKSPKSGVPGKGVRNPYRGSVRTLDFVLGVTRVETSDDKIVPPKRIWNEERLLRASLPSAFAVRGKVVNTRGEPMVGVPVHIATGMFTLLGGGRTITGWDGDYSLRFGPGMRWEKSPGSPMGIGVQAASMSVRPTGWFETGLSQKGNLAMAESRKQYEESSWSKHAVGCVLPNQPYEVSFTLAPAARIEGQVVDKKGSPVAGRDLWTRGEELPPSSSVYASAKTDEQGRFSFESIPTDRAQWIGTRLKNSDIQTEGFVFSKPGTWSATLVWNPKEKSIDWRESATHELIRPRRA